MAVKLTIAGTDETGRLKHDPSPSFTNTLQGRSVARFTLVGGAIPVKKQRVIFYDQDETTKVFQGSVTSVRSGRQESLITWEVEAADGWEFLDRIIVNYTPGIPVIALSRTGSYVTAETQYDHHYLSGDSISIVGAVPVAYNGRYTVTVTGLTTFYFTIAGTPDTPASGSMLAIKTAMVTMRDWLTYLVGLLPASFGVTLGTNPVAGPNFTAFSWDHLTVAECVSDLMLKSTDGYVATLSPDLVLQAAIPGSIAAPFSMTDADPNCKILTWEDSEVNYNRIWLQCGGTDERDERKTWTTLGVQAVSSISRVGTLASAVFGAAHRLVTGDWVKMAGADQAAYNGSVQVFVTGTTTLQYVVMGSPATPATGTITCEQNEWRIDYPIKNDQTVYYLFYEGGYYILGLDGTSAFNLDLAGQRIYQKAGDATWAAGHVAYFDFTAALPFYAIAYDLPDILAHELHERIDTVSDITLYADGLSDVQGRLRRSLAAARTIDFTTTDRGLAVGQTLVVGFASPVYCVGNFLLTEIETTLMNHEFWQDVGRGNEAETPEDRLAYYRNASGVGSGAGSASGGGGGSVTPVATAVHAFLGGMRTASVPMAGSPAYTDVLNYLDYVATASFSGQVRVDLWARNTGVGCTARLYNTTDGTYVESLKRVSQTSVETVFAVSIVIGKTYRLKIISDTASESVYGIGTLEST